MITKTARVDDLLVPKKKIISFVYIDDKVRKWDEMFGRYKYRVIDIKNGIVNLKFYDLQDDKEGVNVPEVLLNEAIKDEEFYVIS